MRSIEQNRHFLGINIIPQEREQGIFGFYTVRSTERKQVSGRCYDQPYKNFPLEVTTGYPIQISFFFFAVIFNKSNR